MKLLMTTALCWIFAGATFAENQSNDQQTLQGKWKVTSVTQDGRDVEAAKGTVFLFDDTKFTAEGKRSMKGTFTVDSDKSPKQMDFLVKAENGNTMTMPMIFKIDEKQLTLCAPRKPGEDRPTEFKSEAGSGFVLIVMEKMKKKDQ